MLFSMTIHDSYVKILLFDIIDNVTFSHCIVMKGDPCVIGIVILPSPW